MAGLMHPTHWMGGVQGVIPCMLASALGAGVSLDAASALFTAYNRACMRLEDEAWLRNNCRDPVFFSKMRAHTTVCADVEANARVGALWAALREVSDGARESMQPLVLPAACLVALLVFFVLVIPFCCLYSQASFHARRSRSLPLHRSGLCLKEA